jgi:hypothetical protein
MRRLFRVLGVTGTALLGIALAIAPVAAFEDRMTIVSALGIAGVALLVGAWLVRRWLPRGDSNPPDAGK